MILVEVKNSIKFHKMKFYNHLYLILIIKEKIFINLHLNFCVYIMRFKEINYSILIIVFKI